MYLKSFSLNLVFVGDFETLKYIYNHPDAQLRTTGVICVKTRLAVERDKLLTNLLSCDRIRENSDPDWDFGHHFVILVLTSFYWQISHKIFVTALI